MESRAHPRRRLGGTICTQNKRHARKPKWLVKPMLSRDRTSSTDSSDQQDFDPSMDVAAIMRNIMTMDDVIKEEGGEKKEEEKKEEEKNDDATPTVNDTSDDAKNENNDNKNYKNQREELSTDYVTMMEKGSSSSVAHLDIDQQLMRTNLNVNSRSVSFINMFAIPRHKKENDENKTSLPKNRFHALAEKFCEENFKVRRWKTSISEEMSGNSNPSIRKFKVTFSRPNKVNPVCQAIASAFIFVSVKGTKYTVDGYQMEGRRQMFGKDVKFNENWVDKIIEEKAKIREMFAMNDQGDFLKTRLPKS